MAFPGMSGPGRKSDFSKYLTKYLEIPGSVRCKKRFESGPEKKFDFSKYLTKYLEIPGTIPGNQCHVDQDFILCELYPVQKLLFDHP